MDGVPILRFAAGSCSRRTGALATQPGINLAAYISSTNIFLVTCDRHHILAVLPAHSTAITALTLHTLPDNSSVLLFTASTDGTASVWKGCAQPSSSWHHLCSWPVHQSQPCVSLAVCTIAQTVTLVTAGMEGILKIWQSDHNFSQWNCLAETQALSSGTFLLECVSICPINSSHAVIAAGGTDSNVYIYHFATSSIGELHPVAKLRGHRDWIRGLAFSQHFFPTSDSEITSSEFYFASASKDATARVWRVQQCAHDEDQDEFAEHTARVVLQLGSEQWAFSAVALLDEHTAAVHSVQFSNVPAVQGDQSVLPKLVTSSMDCTVGVWEAHEDERWTCTARFGLMGGGSAHALGFFGASFSNPDGSEVLGHNFGGALHCWRAEQVGVGEEYGGDVGQVQFFARHAPGGHFAPVTDLVWESKGRYLLSCSMDKTARVYVEVEEKGEMKIVEWARPQVHGHSIFAVAFCDEDGHKYVSGAEEKMLRLFEAPKSFQLPGQISAGDVNGGNIAKATAAVVPELGLSNKATFDAAEVNKDGGSALENNDTEFVSFGAQRESSVVPLEEDLKQRRLWPEAAKLYGHGNEIACVAVDLNSSLLASSCRAQTKKDAAIFLWDINSGSEGGRLSCHDLTVNQVCFSRNGDRLLSASRDRSFAIFRKTGDNKFSFSLALHKRNAHSRLLNACGWILDDEFVVTGSRDKCLKVFAVSGEDAVEVFKEKFNSGVTALTTSSENMHSHETIIAAGFENGAIRVFRMKLDTDSQVSVSCLFETKAENRCGLRVNSLQWRPNNYVDENVNKMELAVASEDCSVRILEFRLKRNESR